MSSPSPARPDHPGSATRAKVEASLRRRYRAERRFRLYGMLAVALGVLAVVVVFASIIGNGWTVFAFEGVFLAPCPK